ncbi:uncharacterized protein [Clytia hemisphaerica]|uniref:Galectin n=1 Tax=Clytia hemisphaerica TaxID=252671 RepID=A0A7M5XKT2_9CNID
MPWKLLVLIGILKFTLIRIGAEKCFKKVPQNYHGVSPLVVIDKEVSGNVLRGIIPVLSPENIVHIKFRINQWTNIEWCAILQFFKGDGVGVVYGHRLPLVMLKQQQGNQHIELSSSVDGVWNHWYGVYSPKLNYDYDVEFRHRYKGSGVYVFTIVVNGEIVMTKDNYQAKQFYDVKMYTGMPQAAFCGGVTISYLAVTNFL